MEDLDRNGMMHDIRGLFLWQPSKTEQVGFLASCVGLLQHLLEIASRLFANAVECETQLVTCYGAEDINGALGVVFVDQQVCA